MARNKTDFTEEDVYAFIGTVDNEERRRGSYELIELMESVSGEKARMWGSAIVGFGSYRYKYESGHDGSAPLIGFRPVNPPFHCMYLPGWKNTGFYWNNSGSLQWERHVFM